MSYKLLLFVSVFSIIICLIHCDYCSLNPYVRGSYLILNRISEDYVISTKRNEHLKADTSITLFCGSGFKPRSNYRNYDYHGDDDDGDDGNDQRRFTGASEKMITVYCDNFNKLSYTARGSKERFSREGQFECSDFAVKFYAKKLPNCNYEGLLYGIDIDGTPKVFAEFCYNYNHTEIVYVHYVAGKRNKLLREQINYNPSKLLNQSLNDFPVFSWLTEKYSVKINLENDLTLFIPNLKHLLNEISYEIHELVPNYLYDGQFREIVGDIKWSNAVPWWMNLKRNNWRTYEKLLIKETTDTEQLFEVYAGHSHEVEYPEGLVCNSENKLKFKMNEGSNGDDDEDDDEDDERSIPLYVWNYIIPRNGCDKEFVLIGVNSPFFEVIEKNNSSLVICDDMCDKIDWLKAMRNTRRIPAFGYIFCCKPEDVAQKLKGFPQKRLYENQSEVIEEIFPTLKRAVFDYL